MKHMLQGQFLRHSRDHSLEKIFGIGRVNASNCKKQLHSKQASKNQARFVRQNQSTMQQEALLHFWEIFFIKMRLKYEKKQDSKQIQNRSLYLYNFQNKFKLQKD